VDEGFGLSALTAAVVAVGSVVAFRKERMDGRDGSPAAAGPEGPVLGGPGEEPADHARYMAAVEAANEAERRRRLEAKRVTGGGCGGACTCGA
jgi:hypothetical protein